MTWIETDDVEQYLAAAGDLLFPDPALHTVALTVVANNRVRPDGTRFAWWDEGGGDVTGAVSHTPPYPLLLSVVPDHAVRPLVEQFEPSAVAGPTAVAAHAAAVRASLVGGTVRLRTAERLHRLTTLAEPDVAGGARLAKAEDLELMASWFGAFTAEAGVIPSDYEQAVRDRLSWDGLVLWEDDGPVAMAGRSRDAFGCVRIGPVYTPPARRRRGYGGAVTAATSRLALDQGAAEVVLFTDLTNATSNALYARLGFAPLADRALLEICSP